MPATFNDSEYQRFHDWLRSEFGLIFGPEKRDILRSRLEPVRVELGADSFEELFFHVKFHPSRNSIRDTLISSVTNNESYFFREPAQLQLLTDDVLPEVVATAKDQKRHTVRILSAGCAGGEEPYTLAIVLRTAGRIPTGISTEIRGIDVDNRALERARAAQYTSNAFRRIDPAIQERFFAQCAEGRWQLDDRVRKMVTFSQANLASSAWTATMPKQDVIFCRNVLIYFDKDGMQAVIERFYEALNPGGFLFLGHSESLSRIPTRFESVRRPGALLYQKPKGSDA